MMMFVLFFGINIVVFGTTHNNETLLCVFLHIE